MMLKAVLILLTVMVCAALIAAIHAHKRLNTFNLCLDTVVDEVEDGEKRTDTLEEEMDMVRGHLTL